MATVYEKEPYEENICFFKKHIYFFKKHNIYFFKKHNIYFFKKHIYFFKKHIYFFKKHMFFGTYIFAEKHIFFVRPLLVHRTWLCEACIHYYNYICWGRDFALTIALSLAVARNRRRNKRVTQYALLVIDTYMAM